MDLTNFVLKCVGPARHGWRHAGSKLGPHVHHLIRPATVVRVWHHASGPVVRSLASVQAGCRYVPLAAGLIAGGAALPGSVAPAQPMIAHTSMVASPAVPSDLIAAAAGAPGGGIPGGGFAGGGFSGPSLPGAALAALSTGSPPADNFPGSSFVSPPSGGGPPPGGPDRPFVPPPQTVDQPPPVQPVPETSSVLMLLSGIALFGLTARRGRMIG